MGPRWKLLWGAEKGEALFRRLSEIYLFCYNLFLQFLYCWRRNNQLKTVASMLSCGALESSNNPYIESIVEPCVSMNQKGIFAIWKENPEKGLKEWKKVSLSWKRNLCVCVWEIKNLKILKWKNVNLPFKKDFKFAELLSKATFSFTLGTILKMTKGTN